MPEYYGDGQAICVKVARCKWLGNGQPSLLQQLLLYSVYITITKAQFIGLITVIAQKCL